MKTYELTDNCTGGNTIRVTLTDKHAKVLKNIQYAGGFLRFNMELFDEFAGKGKTELTKLIPFLQDVFIIVSEPKLKSLFA